MNGNNTTMSCCETSAFKPKWHPPSPSSVTHDVGLMVMNSLTRKKEKFVTIDGSRSVRWYMCGPTVYAPSHMGHARAYLSFDIIRRILTSHFSYDVNLVMNITDLDDKIIERANEQNISCTELSRHFENEFHEDMAALGVSPPDVLTRVTEYMPEIVTYISTIISKNLAYESNGSVYFDVEAFTGTPNMQYCKLCPEQINNAELLAEGEGKLTQDFISDKKSPRDFALWKASKENEPSWPSPWGQGRPGWHIECSVMASDVFTQLGCTEGGIMDVHSGGVDLKFPHHDNEMAQAEAQAGCVQWVNYFVHAGHLHIKGFKMSKSLKNFITIQQALTQNTPRQIRFCFLLHKYNAPMDYGDNTMAHAVEREKFFAEFFHNVKAALRDFPLSSNQHWDERAKVLQRTLLLTKTKVNDALRDDFDTPTVISSLGDLVKATNLYLENNDQVISLVVRGVAVYVTSIFKVFGLVSDGVDIGYSSGSSSDDTSSQLTPVLDALMSFRSSVRDKARSKDVAGVLDDCDSFRDDALPPLGIRLEDKSGGASVWKLDDPEVLMKERELKLMDQKRKEEEKAKAKLEQNKKDMLNKLSPEEFMKQLTIDDGQGNEKMKYSKFDDKGMPTHWHNGEELNKSQEKKAKKEFQGQAKKYEKYLQKK